MKMDATQWGMQKGGFWEQGVITLPAGGSLEGCGRSVLGRR